MKVFISYRREDADAWAHQVHRPLARAFGAKNVFIDVDARLRAGHDYRRQLEARVDETDVMVVVIGRGWQSSLASRQAAHDSGAQPDFVRIELAKALASNKPIIPLLVSGAAMPAPADLPDDVRDVVFREGRTAALGPSFDTDMARLVAGIRDAVKPEPRAPSEGRSAAPLVIGSTLVAVALGAVVVWSATDWSGPQGGAPGTAGETPALTPPAESGAEAASGGWAVGETFQECDECPEMVVVPAGSFTMGSPDDEPGRDVDEGPQRRVTLAQPFAVGKYEVTFEQWDACVSDGFCRAITDDEGWGRDDQPVINVSWAMITGEGVAEDGFLAWLNSKVEGAPYRLLTEAEWEDAARAGSQDRWSFGDDEARLGDHAWYRANANSRAQSVGGKAANAFGLHDMHGNVWEWVQDCWHGDYNGAPVDGSAWMEADDGGCSRAVLRGGSWFDTAQGLRSAVRDWYPRGIRRDLVGFRVARTIIDR